MKAKEREEARRLRKDEGLSLKEIARVLKVSKTSVSLWVRDIELTQDQKVRLELNNPIYRGQSAGASKNRKVALEMRRKSQIKGRDLAKKFKSDCKFSIGCALYWAEGGKDRNTISMANMESQMLIIFRDWLIKYFDCKKEKFRIKISAYLDCGITVEDINQYWSETLGLLEDSIGKFILRSKYYTGENRKKVAMYGCCTLCYYDTKIKQMIFGAIQELMGFDCEEWVL